MHDCVVHNLCLIVAATKDGVIGVNNKLPWHLPEDLRHFRQLTIGKCIIMGRKTWQSLPTTYKPLPGRRNIVVSRQAEFLAPGAQTSTSLAEAIELAASNSDDDFFVIGGASLYELALPLTKRIYLTEIDLKVKGDACFPALPNNVWQESARRQQISANGIRYAFVTLTRR